VKDKVVIITGASSGIGEALAYKFASKGSKIVIGARNHDRLSAVANNIKKLGAEFVFAQTDVCIEGDCRNLVLTAYENFGKIDILINNAGMSMRALFKNAELEVIKKLMDTNFWGAVYCTKYALPYILKEKGSIVGVSSACNEVVLIFDSVKPGNAMRTCNPVLIFSVRSEPKKPFMAYLDAE